jgi:hypothetical protein
MDDGDPVLSRHRLPHPYRVGLTVMWIVPLLVFIAAMIIGRGVDWALVDPRFVAPALIMIAPALYFWHEGIDVRRGGIYRRIHLPGYYPFSEMARWQYDRREDLRVLTIWDWQGQKIVECRAGHLTDFPALLETLEERL